MSIRQEERGNKMQMRPWGTKESATSVSIYQY